MKQKLLLFFFWITSPIWFMLFLLWLVKEELDTWVYTLKQKAL